MAYINKEHMKGHEYIRKFREYLDYLEEHFENVRRAFNELSDKCDGMWWVGDDAHWFTLREQVCNHDLSKFSKQEFTGYRRAFFPIEGEAQYEITAEWEHHKYANSHHHESVKNGMDVIHMIIDWTAMGYKFGDTAQEYYEKNKGRIDLSDEHIEIMYEIFNKVADN